MCGQNKKKSDIRGVDKDYEAHTAANKNGFRGGGEAENGDIVRRGEFVAGGCFVGEWRERMVGLTINVLRLAYNVQFYTTRYLILTCYRSSHDKLKILLLSVLSKCEGKSHYTHTRKEILRETLGDNGKQ